MRRRSWKRAVVALTLMGGLAHSEPDGLTTELPFLQPVQSPNYTNKLSAVFGYMGTSPDPAKTKVQASFDPTFSTFAERAWWEDEFGYRVPFTVPLPTNWQDGLHTVYHRLESEAGVSNVQESQVFLDRVPPEAVVPVAESPYAANGIVKIMWKASPSDPAPSSSNGGSTVEYRMYRDEETDRNNFINGDELTTLSTTGDLVTLTYVLPKSLKGGAFRLETVASDGCRNFSAWKAAPIEINAKPFVAQIAFSPVYPDSGQSTRAVATAIDPDGDAITEIRYSFRPTYAGPDSIPVEGPILPADQVRKGQAWTVTAIAIDSHGAIGWEATQDFLIGHGMPTQPFVELRPRAPQPGQAIDVQVLQNGTDPDGDQLDFDYRWYLSRDGGAIWTRRHDLDGSAQLSSANTAEGDLWRVEYVPYEVSLNLPFDEGRPGSDTVLVSASNTPPELQVLEAPQMYPTALGTTRVRAAWTVSDAEGGPLSFDVYLTDRKAAGLVLVRMNVDAAAGFYDFETSLGPDGPYYVHLVVRDNRGAITQRTSPALVQVAPENAVGLLLR